MKLAAKLALLLISGYLLLAGSVSLLESARYAAFQAGIAEGTRLAHAGCIAWRTDRPKGLHICMWRD